MACPDGGETLEASRDTIDLWLTFFDQLRDSRLLEIYRKILTPEERKNESSFFFEIDRRRYLVTRALLRTVLSQYIAIKPELLRFSYNNYGRPEIANSGDEARAISFNLSHTNSLIVLGVTRERAIGVDVENVLSREPPLEIADRYFAPDEVEALRTLAAAQQIDRFFEYWTFKESYIKARGLGLSIPLDRFSFDFCRPRCVRLTIDADLSDDEVRWRLWQFRPDERYLVAVCAESVGGAPPQVNTRAIVPLVSCQPMILAASRISDG